jgi:hypothetical protein
MPKLSSFTNSFYLVFIRFQKTVTVLLLYWQYRAVRAGVGNKGQRERQRARTRTKDKNKSKGQGQRQRQRAKTRAKTTEHNSKLILKPKIRTSQ